MPVDWVVIGLDNGGTTNNGTVLDAGGRFLLDRWRKSRATQGGPGHAIQSVVESWRRCCGSPACRWRRYAR